MPILLRHWRQLTDLTPKWSLAVLIAVSGLLCPTRSWAGSHIDGGLNLGWGVHSAAYRYHLSEQEVYATASPGLPGLVHLGLVLKGCGVSDHSYSDPQLCYRSTVGVDLYPAGGQGGSFASGMGVKAFVLGLPLFAHLGGFASSRPWVLELGPGSRVMASASNRFDVGPLLVLGVDLVDGKALGGSLNVELMPSLFPLVPQDDPETYSIVVPDDINVVELRVSLDIVAVLE